MKAFIDSIFRNKAKTGGSGLIVILLIFMISAACKQTGADPGQNDNGATVAVREYSVSQLQEDFSSLRSALENNHPLLYHYYSKEDFDNFFDSVYNSIQRDMTELEFFRLLAPLVARVNCGHTNVRPSNEYENYLESHIQVIPLGIVFMNNKAYIYQNYGSNNEILPGSEVISINNVRLSTILENLLAGMSADGLNVTFKIHRLNKLFFRYYSLLIDNPGSFDLECKLPGSSETSRVNLHGQLYRDVYDSFVNQNPGESGSSLRSQKLPESSTAVLTIKSFSISRSPGYQTFFNDFFQDISAADIKNLVIDVRGNGGGAPEFSVDLLRYLMDYDFVYFAEGIGYNWLRLPVSPYELNFNGSIYFLINGGCFSTTGHFCSLAQFHGLGVFIGEETGGSFSCSDNHLNMILSNTQLRVTIARTIYSTAVSGYVRGRGIMPDFEISPTLEDRVSGFDREMDYVLSLIEQL